MIGLENVPIVELLTLYFLRKLPNACYAVEIGSHATGSGNVGGTTQRTWIRGEIYANPFGLKMLDSKPWGWGLAVYIVSKARDLARIESR